MNASDQAVQKVNRVSTSVNLLFVAAAAVLFNFFPQYVGTWRTVLDADSFKPLLGPGFQTYLFALNLLWGAIFTLGIANLILGHWTPLTRLARLAINLFAAVLLTWMALGPSFTLDPLSTAVAKSLVGVLALIYYLRVIQQARALDIFIRVRFKQA
ncbi:MAG: hypothetical protein P8074_15235 [Anaerolineales bacterium]|jgi:hypothetical protein